MAFLAAVVLAAPLLEDDDLVTAGLIDDLGEHRGLVEDRHADTGRLAGLGDHQHVLKLKHGAGLAGQLLDDDHVVPRHSVLLTAGFDDSEHGPPEQPIQRGPATIREALPREPAL